MYLEYINELEMLKPMTVMMEIQSTRIIELVSHLYRIQTIYISHLT